MVSVIRPQRVHRQRERDNGNTVTKTVHRLRRSVRLCRWQDALPFTAGCGKPGRCKFTTHKLFFIMTSGLKRRKANSTRES